MLRPYRDLLRLPGALAFSCAGLLGRLPISMLGLGIVFLVREATGRYALAGSVVAAFVLAQAVSAPLLGRLVDRVGQRRVLLPAVVVHASAMATLLLCAGLGAPVVTYFLAAAAAGASMLSVGSLVRTRWSALVGGTPSLHTAFSYESVVDELVFIVGPVAVTLLATGLTPTIALAVATALGVVGVVIFAGLRSTEPRPAGTRHSEGTALRISGLRTLVVVFAALGLALGALDVVVVAVLDEWGHRGAAGAVLAVFALGSGLSGLVYGLRHFTAGPDRRLLVGAVAMAVTAVPLGLMPSIPALAVAAFACGLAISPTLIPGNQLVENLMPEARMTEGLTWTVTAIGLGVAAGASAAGVVVDAVSPRAGFAVVVVGSLLTVLVTGSLRRTLVPAPTPGTPAAVPAG